MSNIVRTRITITNNDGDFDFKKDFSSCNDVIKMPHLLAQVQKYESLGSVSNYLKSNREAITGKTNVGTITDLQHKFPKIPRIRLHHFLSCFTNHGHLEEYDWCCDNWGANGDFTIAGTGNDWMEFDTDWDCPAKALNALAKKYPQYDFFGEYASDDAGTNAGEFDISDSVFALTPDINHSTRAFERYFELVGPDDNYVYDEQQGTYLHIDDVEVA